MVNQVLLLHAGGYVTKFMNFHCCDDLCRWGGAGSECSEFPTVSWTWTSPRDFTLEPTPKTDVYPI